MGGSMICRVRVPLALAIAAAASLAAVSLPASAANLPQVELSASNKVPVCTTPGRLMAFLESRNPNLDARFATIAADYMRLGEKYNIRWDIAFFQMMLETGNLKFGGDVASTQNNFAGLGATGKHVPGESFPDIETGVKAHLQHLLLYAGEHLDNPVAERTRKVQEWGVLHRLAKDAEGPDRLRSACQAVGADVTPLCTRYRRPRRGILRQPVQRCRSESRVAGARQAGARDGKIQNSGEGRGRARDRGPRKLLLTSPQTRQRRNFPVPIWRAAPSRKPADPDRSLDRASVRSRWSLRQMLLRSPSANRRRQIRLRPRSRLSTPPCRKQRRPPMLRLKATRAALPTQRPSSRRRKAQAKRFRPRPSAPEPSRSFRPA